MKPAKPFILLGFALLFAAIYLFPLYWMYVTALKSGSEIFAFPPSFWPTDPQWQFGRIFAEQLLRPPHGVRERADHQCIALRLRFVAK